MSTFYPPVTDSLDRIRPGGTRSCQRECVLKMPVTANSSLFNNPRHGHGRRWWDRRRTMGATTGPRRRKNAEQPADPLQRPASSARICLPSGIRMVTFPRHITFAQFCVPGAPFVVIVINGNYAWGITSDFEQDIQIVASRSAQDESRQEYWFDRRWQTSCSTAGRYDQRIVGAAPLYENAVADTVSGPVPGSDIHGFLSDIQLDPVGGSSLETGGFRRMSC